MANTSFKNSIGHGGSKPINSASINLNQRPGSAAAGYSAPKATMKGAAKDRISPDAGCGPDGTGMSASSVDHGAGKNR